MKMTEKRLIDMIRAGYGQGHGNNYRPWLKNTRSAISKKGTQSSGKVLYGLNRACDFKSRQEKRISRALLWLGAADVREQFPIWPWPHPHPLLGAPGAELLVLPDAPGLLEIAQRARIPHGVFVGTDLPYVATVDYMVTLRSDHTPRLVAIACKDREIVLDNDRLSRALERLELERLYCNSLRIPHLIVESDVFGDTLLTNLDWLMPDEQIATDLLQDMHLAEFRDQLGNSVFQTGINQVIEDASTSIGWTKSRGLSAFRYLAWAQAFDIDLTRPIVMTQPALSGGTKIRRLLQLEIFGELDHARYDSHDY